MRPIPKSATALVAGAGNIVVHTNSTGLIGGIAGTRKFKLTGLSLITSGAGLVTLMDGGAAGVLRWQVSPAGAANIVETNLEIEFFTDVHIVNAAAINIWINISGEEI